MNHNRIVLSLVAITFISVFVFSSNTVSADTTVTKNAKIIVPPVCSIGATGMNTHTTTVEIGTYKTNIGTTTATVTCNDSEGFSIYASGFTGDKVGDTNSNKLVGTSISSNSTISTGTASSGGTSSWSMKLAPDASSNPQYPITILSTYSDYASVPSDYTKVATRTAATDIGTGAEGSTFTTTYAAYIANTQAADTYTGKVKYVLVHPNTNTVPTEQATTPGKITYYPNASDVVGEMGQQTLERVKDWSVCSYTNYTTYCRDSSFKSIDISTLPELDYYEPVLYAPNFKRAGYGFAGWNTEPDYSGTMYGPTQTTHLSLGEGANGLALYATWVPSEGSMQHFAISACSKLTKASTDGTTTLDSVSALTDLRDGNTYAIAKLADNKCWMIENLRLDDSAILTSGNTHNPSLPLTNNDGATSNHLSPTTDPTQTAWCSSTSAACYDQSMLNTSNTVFFTNNTSSNYELSRYVYSYGNYYNWYSATSGNGKYGATGENSTVVGDICPVGWHLPIGGNKSNKNNNEFWSLGISIIGTEPANTSSRTQPYYTGVPEGKDASGAMRTYPNNFIYSGAADMSSIDWGGSYAYYWTATALSGEYASDMVLGYNSFSPGTNTSREYVGRSVRCIMDN